MFIIILNEIASAVESQSEILILAKSRGEERREEKRREERGRKVERRREEGREEEKLWKR